MDSWITRRSFGRWLGFTLAGSGGMLVLPSAALGADVAIIDGDTLSSSEEDTVMSYSYTLLPILDPADPRYRDVAERLAQMADQNPGIAALIFGGVKALNMPGKTSWGALSQEQRAAVVGSEEGTPFFNVLHWITAEVVMRDPVLWKNLGYQGSAIEHGGYVGRGFDDIDWLPKPAAGAGR